MATEFDHRRDLALNAIVNSVGTDAAKYSVNLFLEHHLSELPSTYWMQHFGVDRPDTSKIVGLLVLRSSWGEEDLEYFDFTLPGEVTDYVLSVRFDETGEIDEISMES